MKNLLSIIMIISLASCSKTNLIPKKVDVQQSGELVRVSGYIDQPLSYDYSYSVKVKFCDKWVDLLVVIPAGQVNGYADYVTDESVMCRFSEYKITYEGKLIQ
jgi:hypothetical protein